MIFVFDELLLCYAEITRAEDIRIKHDEDICPNWDKSSN